MRGRALEKTRTFEEMCVSLEAHYAEIGMVCHCCADFGNQCGSCQYALGWHICEKAAAALSEQIGPDEEVAPLWKAGTLHQGQLVRHSAILFHYRHCI